MKYHGVYFNERNSHTERRSLPPFDDPIGLLYAKTEKEESLGGALKYIQR